MLTELPIGNHQVSLLFEIRYEAFSTVANVHTPIAEQKPILAKLVIRI